MTLLHGKNYGRPTLDLNFAENKSLIDTVTGRNLITFSRSQSGKEATYVGSDGLIKYAGADEPRFDYDPVSGVCKGLLIEEQRTNGVFQSGQIGATPWVLVGSGTANLNAAIAPDGTLTATRIQANTYISGNTHGFGSNGCQSIFVKADSTSIIDIRNVNNSNWLRFDIDLGTITPIGASVVYSQEKIEYFANGWARISYFGGTGSAFVFRTIPTTETIFVWGAQAELGSFPTSYIPTSGAQVTRNADEASITGSNFSGFYNQSEGTFFADSKSLPNNLGFVVAVISETDGFNPRSFAIDRKIDSGPGLYSGYWRDYTAGDFATLISSNNQESGKSSLGYGPSGLSFTSNGGNVITNAGTYNFTSPPLAYIIIGSGYSIYVGGTISRLTYWPKRLPDLELQQLTK
jgi:hypothetical protein